MSGLLIKNIVDMTNKKTRKIKLLILYSPLYNDNGEIMADLIINHFRIRQRPPRTYTEDAFIGVKVLYMQFN